MMIRKIALAIVLGVFTAASSLYGQLTIDIGDHTGDTGGTVDVPLVANGFIDITTMEFRLTWDPSVMTFNSIVSVADVDDLSEASFGTPPGLAEGMISCSFFDGDAGSNLTSGNLVVFRFNLVGGECDETTIAMNSDAFFTGPDFNTQPLSASGSVKINGADCGGGSGGGTDLTTTAAMVTGEPGSQICVPVTVQNFEALTAGIGVGSGAGNICWDPAVLTYTGIENNQLPSQFSLNEATVSNGFLRFVWFDFGPDSEEIYDDGSTLFEICFDAIGSAGDMSPIDLKEWEWADNTSANTDIPDVEVDGKVTLANAPAEQFELIISEEIVNAAGRVCVDITTNNFEDIVALEYRIQWDASVLSFGSLAADVVDRNSIFGLVDPDMSYSAPDNFFTMSWTSSTGLDLPDGTSLYKVCFDAPCAGSSPVSIVPNNASSIIVGVEVGGTSTTLPASSISIDNGSIDVVCGPDCTVTTVSTTGACPGTQSGNITVSVSVDPSVPSTCQWTNAAGQVVGNDCNLFGVAPGDYTLTVSVGGMQCTTHMETVPTLDAPTISGTTTPAGCGQGQINATITNAASFVWNPTLDPVPNPMADAGTYTLTATAATGCMTSMTFVVGEEIETLEINPMSTNPSCVDATDGSINLNITGGCAPYSVVWSDMGDGTGLGNGTYSATVTDDKGTVVSSGDIVLSTVGMSLNGNPLITNSSGSDGAISITVTGGVEPYNYAWTPSGQNSGMITGLAPDSYTVLVTDASGCMMSFGPYVVVLEVTGTVELILSGTNILCGGDNTGAITVNVNTDLVPGMLNLTGPDIDESINIDEGGATTFSMLLAGDYTATYTDSNGETTSENITITENEALALTSEIGCENNDQEDGFIDVSVTGGSGMLTYVWGIEGEDTESLNNLTEGSYMVSVTDEEGCNIIETFTVTACDTIPQGCYEFSKIITPNGDGKNDVFTARCLDNPSAELTVFNRWGQMVFNMPAYDGSWAGTGLNSEALIEGGYMWVLDIDFGSGRRELRKGTVTILRD